MSVVSDALSVLDEGRAVLDDVGLRPYRVFVRVIQQTGTRLGDGDENAVDTEITVANGRRPKVVQVKDDDVVSGGVYTKTRYEIQNITPPYTGGGVDPSTLDPAAGSTPAEVYYVIIGPGTPAEGRLCKKVGDKFDRPFGFNILVETIGQDVGT